MIDLDISYLPWQEQFFFEDQTRFKLLHKGRRLGFTQGGSQAVIEWMLEGKYKRILWGDTVLGNIEKYVARYFMPVLRQLPEHIYNWQKQDKMLTVGNMTADFRSADQPEKWEGFGYDLILLNEAGIILRNEYLYDNAVRPMLLDNPQSHFICGGTPKGKNHKGMPHKFFQLVQSARKNPEKWSVHHYTTFDNPLLSRDEINEMIAESSEAVARQEVYGEFLDEDASVLIDYDTISDACERDYPLQMIEHAPRSMGIDVGWSGDPTIICKLQGLVAHPLIEIPPARDDTVTAQRIAEYIDDWGPDAVFVDYGFGTGVVATLNNMGHRVTGVHFGEAALDPTKYANRRAEMYDRGRTALVQGEQLPDDPKLKADIGVVQVGYDSKGRMLLEKKELVKQRLGRSTDRGDAWALCHAAPVRRKEIFAHNRQAVTSYDPFTHNRIEQQAGIKQSVAILH